MKDLISKLTNIEATAPKAKKMLTEDSATPAKDTTPSFKDVFESIAGMKPIPVVGKEGSTQQTGAGFANVTDPALQNLGKTIGDLAAQKKLQIVVPTTGQQSGTTIKPTNQPTQPGQTTQPGQPNQAGVTGQPQQGQMQMKEKDEGKPGKNFAKIAKDAAKRYGSKEAGERVAGAVRAKLAKQGKLEENQSVGRYWFAILDPALVDKIAELPGAEVDPDAGSVETTDPKLAQQLANYAAKNPTKLQRKQSSYVNKSRAEFQGGSVVPNDMVSNRLGEGAKVDRMVKHIEKSERKLGKSKEKASDIAWATVNKRGMLDNKNKKKVKEADIPSTAGVDTKGAGLGAGRNEKFLEGNQMNKQVNEIFGFSAKEKAAKSDEALKAKFAQAMKINNVLEKSKAVDDLALDAIRLGKGSDFFRSLGFKSDVRYPKGWYETMPYWSGTTAKPSFHTVYGMEALMGPLTPKHEISMQQANKFAENDPRGFKPGHAPSIIWLVPGGNGQRFFVWLHNANMSEGRKPDKNKNGIPDYAEDGKGPNDLKKKKKKTNESMNHRISAARLEGKSHGLKGHAHCGKSYEDLEERKAYHEGYVDGLDECYGMGVYEDMTPATVSGMATQALDELSPATRNSYITKSLNSKWGAETSVSPDGYYKAKHPDNVVGADAETVRKRNAGLTMADKKGWYTPEEEMEEGNAFTAALARTPKGGKFSVGGKSFTDHSNYDSSLDEYAFESWNKQLKGLLNEGLSVSISKGLEGGHDSATVTATDGDADKLMALVKQAGLGVFGAEDTASDYGAPSDSGEHGGIKVVGDHDGMMGLMKKLAGVEQAGASDYADEEGDEGCGCEETNEATCNECGMMEAQCKCHEGNEMVDEMESEDQMTYQVAEETGVETDAQADEEDEAKEDQALATSDKAEDEEDELEESFTFEGIFKKLAMLENADNMAGAMSKEDLAKEIYKIYDRINQQENTGFVGSIPQMRNKLASLQAQWDRQFSGEDALKMGLALWRKYHADNDAAKAAPVPAQAQKKPFLNRMADKAKQTFGMKEEQLDELTPELLNRAAGEAGRRQKAAAGSKKFREKWDMLIVLINSGRRLLSPLDAYEAIENGELKPDDKVRVYSENGNTVTIAKSVPELSKLFTPSSPAEKYWAKKADKFSSASAAASRDEKIGSYSQQTANMSPAQKRQFDKMKSSGELNEWANQIGKDKAGKGTDAQFEQDIDFMTKVISGGLNKPKSTGQTTIPVVAGQVDRMVDSPTDWATLAGIKKA